MLLILAEPHDRVARSVSERVSASGGNWWWLTPLDLATARWTHLVEGRGAGGVTTRIRTTAGLSADLGDVTGVLNRIAWLPPVPCFQPRDREYALMERHALLTSVLAAISAPMVNPVRPPSLSGPVLDPVSWLMLAAKCAVPVRGLRLTTDGRRWQSTGWVPLDWLALTTAGVGADVPLPASVPVGRRPVAWGEPVGRPHRVIVVGDHAFDAPDAGWARHCMELGFEAGCPLLEVTVAPRRMDGSWVVTGLDPMPTDLPPAAIDALARMLGGDRAVDVPVGERRSS